MSRKSYRPWTKLEKTRLIRLWQLVPSIALIAIELNRSMSSIHSQAVQMGLPRRYNKFGKSYTRWTISEFIKFGQSLVNHIDADNKIHIAKFADEVNRSVDAVIAKIIEIVGDEESVLSHCYAPLDMYFVDQLKVKFSKDQENAKTRKCLTCLKPFWSTGEYNRICLSCTKANRQIEFSEHSYVK